MLLERHIILQIQDPLKYNTKGMYFLMLQSEKHKPQRLITPTAQQQQKK